METSKAAELYRNCILSRPTLQSMSVNYANFIQSKHSPDHAYRHNGQTSVAKSKFSPLTAGPDYIRFLTFLINTSHISF